MVVVRLPAGEGVEGSCGGDSSGEEELRDDNGRHLRSVLPSQLSDSSGCWIIFLAEGRISKLCFSAGDFRPRDPLGNRKRGRIMAVSISDRF